jgi:hypothetical protein
MTGQLAYGSARGNFSASKHPYWPIGAAIPAYEQNESPLWLLLASFAAMLCIAISTALALAKRANPTITALETATIGWFVLC